MGIVVIGSVFVDIKGYPLDKYLPDGRNAGSVMYMHGGVARNVAEDVANTGTETTFLSVVDESALADDVLRRLNSRQVNTSYINRIPGGMGTWLAIFNENGDVAGSISVRPKMESIADVLDVHGDRIVGDCDALIIEADIERPVLERALSLAEKYHKLAVSVVSNMSICLERYDMLQRFHCFICNRQEAGLLFNRDFEGETPERIAAIVADCAAREGFRQVVVTLGEHGAVYVDAHGKGGTIPAMKVTVRDTTGCGDAFCAGVAVGLSKGVPLALAVRTGIRLASAVIESNENVCPRYLPGELDL